LLNSPELNYTITEKEMLSVMHALRVWRCYLEGAHFTVYTDHVSNTYFHMQGPNLSRWQARWSEFLQRFGIFKWEYRKGANNVADALSQRDVAGSDSHYYHADKFLVFGTASGIVADDREMYQRITSPGQDESVVNNQISADSLTFDLSIPLLKSLTNSRKSECILESPAICKLGSSKPTKCQRSGPCA
jgi:hypothetical protein